MIDGLVSIITPCYNAAQFVGRTIESVTHQTYGNWELIVVYDGSTDSTAQVVERWVERDRRVSLIRQRNAGTAAARNAAMHVARGRYIALLDADDLWMPEFLEHQLDFMRQKKALCVCSAYRRIDAEDREIQHPTVPLAVITLRDMRVMNRIGCLTGLYDASEHGKVYLHEELKSIRDDYAYWYDIISLAGRAYGNPEVLASYRVLSGSTTGNKLPLVAKQFRFYRQYLREGLVRAAINTLRWGISGIRKFS